MKKNQVDTLKDHASKSYKIISLAFLFALITAFLSSCANVDTSSTRSDGNGWGAITGSGDVVPTGK